MTRARRSRTVLTTGACALVFGMVAVLGRS